MEVERKHKQAVDYTQQGSTTSQIKTFELGRSSGDIKRYFPDGDIGSTMPAYNEYPDNVVGMDTDAPKKAQKQHAYSFLETAVKEMKDRAIQRDVQNGPTGGAGERSMASTIRAFNALTGHKLTEAEGWEFMILLKLVRGRQGDFRMDDYVDAAAYCGLLGECESVSR